MPLSAYTTYSLTDSEKLGFGPPHRSGSDAILHSKFYTNSLLSPVRQPLVQNWSNDARKILSRSRSQKAARNPLFKSGLDPLWFIGSFVTKRWDPGVSFHRVFLQTKSGYTHSENSHFQSGFRVNFQSGYTHFVRRVLRHVFSSQDDVPKAPPEPCWFFSEIIRIWAIPERRRPLLSGGSNPTFSESVNE